MEKHQVESEATVLVATLASTKPLNASSLLCSTICTLLLIFSEHILLQGLAGIGILAGLIQSYFNWRVVLDRKLIPLLIQFGTTRFDQALSTVFQSKAQQLGSRDLHSRLAGARSLLKQQGFWLMLQLGITIGAIGLHLYLGVQFQGDLHA